jgi:hypothetical protein
MSSWESQASTLVFRPRMFESDIQLRRDTGLPVLPIALFLSVGLECIGWVGRVQGTLLGTAVCPL